MTDVKHTLGPWELELLDDGSFYVFTLPTVDMGSAFTVCRRGSIAHRVDQSHANARLIAAAPELLDGARGLLELLDQIDDEAGSDERVQQARAAIAKATGAHHAP